MMPSSNRITRLASSLYVASTVLAYALPSLVIFGIARGWFDPAVLSRQFPALPSGLQITPFQGTLVASIGVFSVFPVVASFLAMRRLFARYRQGEILTDACSGDILRIGRASILVSATTVLSPMLQVLVMSWNAPTGRMLSLTIDGNTIGFLLAGGLLFTIGWVMREAALAAAENAEFV